MKSFAVTQPLPDIVARAQCVSAGVRRRAIRRCSRCWPTSRRPDGSRSAPGGAVVRRRSACRRGARAAIERAFGCPLHNEYGASECLTHRLRLPRRLAARQRRLGDPRAGRPRLSTHAARRAVAHGAAHQPRQRRAADHPLRPGRQRARQARRLRRAAARCRRSRSRAAATTCSRCARATACPCSWCRWRCATVIEDAAQRAPLPDRAANAREPRAAPDGCRSRARERGRRLRRCASISMRKGSPTSTCGRRAGRTAGAAARRQAAAGGRAARAPWYDIIRRRAEARQKTAQIHGRFPDCLKPACTSHSSRTTRLAPRRPAPSA